MPELETPAEVPAEQPIEKTQAEIDALVDETLGLPKAKEPEAPAEKPVEAETPEEVEEPETPEEPEEPEEQEETPDPEDGLFIEVEDADGKKYKITSVEDLPEDFSPKNNRQIIQIVSELGKLDKKRDDLAADQAEQAVVQAAEEKRKDMLSNWDAEIADLQADGTLPRTKAKPNTPEWKKDPAVQKVDAVFKFITTENEKRKADGQPPLRSFTLALNKFDKIEAKKAEDAELKNSNDVAKQKAALVSRGSTNGVSAPSVYKAGQYRDIMDVPVAI